MPRDIDPLCASIEGVTLRDIDDLQSAVTHNLSSRAADIPAAEEIVEVEIKRFAEWLGQLDVRPTIAALRERGDEHRRARARGECGALGLGLRRATWRASRRSPAR